MIAFITVADLSPLDWCVLCLLIGMLAGCLYMAGRAHERWSQERARLIRPLRRYYH